MSSPYRVGAQSILALKLLNFDSKVVGEKRKV